MRVERREQRDEYREAQRRRQQIVTHGGDIDDVGPEDQARAGLNEAISVADVPASVTGTGSLFRIHMKAEAPTDYRSAFPTPEESRRLTRFVDALYDNGIMMVHTAMGALSTAMGNDEIDQLADAVLTGLRRAKA